MSGMLHIVVGHLPPDTDQAAPLATTLALGSVLTDVPGVQATLLGCSSKHVVTACWLDSPTALESFAASDAHMAFVIHGLAPLVHGMWSTSVPTDALPTNLTTIAELWAFAIPEQGGVYEWEVRRLLDSVASLPGFAITGPTVGERERFRAGGIVTLSAEEVTPFERAIKATRTDWPTFATEIEEARVPVFTTP